MRTSFSILFMFLMITANATDYYVATNDVSASDSNNGTSISAPFKTIKKAASVAVAGDVVFVREGVYRETVVPAKSGTSGKPIVFQPYNNELVTISGTEIITGWTNHSGNIYKAALPGTFMNESHNQSDQIFVDGQMMSIARYPNNTNLDPSYPAKSVFTKFVSKSTSGNITTGKFTDSKLPPNDYVGAEIYVQPNNDGWSWTFTGTVTEIAGAQVTFTSFNGSGKDGNNAVYDPKSRFYIFNKLSLLDAAGEWYHDKTNGLLYLWCPADSDPNIRTVEAKKREYAFDLTGKSYITIKGFSLFGCTITTDNASGGNNKGYDASGNVVYPWRGAGSVASGKACVIDGIKAKYLSHFTDCSGHFMFQWGQSSGMVISGRDHIIKNCELRYSAGNGIMLLGYNCKAMNNLITDMAYNATDASGINTGGVAPTFDHEIAYNTIKRTGRSGMTPRLLKNSSNTNLIARIHHNDISEFMLQDWDGGGLYSAGESNFIRIDHNTVHDGIGYTVGGIYLDWAKNYVIDHNVVWNVEWGIHLQESYNGTGISNHICYNNTVVVYKTSYDYGPFAFGGSGPANSQTGTICQNNILVYRKGNSSTASSGFKTFSDAYGNASKITNLLHPADPKFVDFVNVDLKLLAGSPAIDAGTLMTSQTLDGITVPAYNDEIVGTMDIGAYEYGQPLWSTGCSISGIDIQSPSSPMGCNFSNLGSTSFTLSWNASTDNVGVSAYEIFKNGVSMGTSASTSLEVSGLNPATSYTMTVRAFDAAGNVSGVSLVLIVKTLPATGIENSVAESTGKLFVFPNPASESALVEFNSLSTDPISLSVFTVKGSLVKCINQVAIIGLNRIEINTKDIKTGVYIIKFKQNDSINSLKLVIDKN